MRLLGHGTFGTLKNEENDHDDEAADREIDVETTNVNSGHHTSNCIGCEESTYHQSQDGPSVKAPPTSGPMTLAIT